jgi:hypothetical protein
VAMPRGSIEGRTSFDAIGRVAKITCVTSSARWTRQRPGRYAFTSVAPTSMLREA